MEFLRRMLNDGMKFLEEIETKHKGVTTYFLSYKDLVSGE